MIFKPKTYPVDLAAVSGPDQRMALIIQALPQAERELGEKPTHMLIDSDLRLNLEPLLEMGLRVRRRSMPSAWQLVVRLVVETPELEPRSRGGPAPIPVQARLM